MFSIHEQILATHIHTCAQFSFIHGRYCISIVAHSFLMRVRNLSCIDHSGCDVVKLIIIVNIKDKIAPQQINLLELLIICLGQISLFLYLNFL